jgi:heme/copper-type cytochrome/quinol oxidase subunit 2
MASLRGISLLLSILTGLLLGWLVWALLRYRRATADGSRVDTRGDVLLVLLALAAFSLGSFVAYLLLLSL